MSDPVLRLVQAEERIHKELAKLAQLPKASAYVVHRRKVCTRALELVAQAREQQNAEEAAAAAAAGGGIGGRGDDELTLLLQQLSI